MLAQNGFAVSGIDFAPGAIRQATELAHKAGVADSTKFITGDALDLPFKTNAFDVVNDDGCLHHIEPELWGKYIQGVARVLKTGGVFRLKAFSKNCEYYYQNVPAGSSAQWLQSVSSGFTYFFTEQEIRKITADNFETVQLYESAHSVTDDKRFFFGIFKKM